jgi:hypothetical protein
MAKGNRFNRASLGLFGVTLTLLTLFVARLYVGSTAVAKTRRFARGRTRRFRRA